MKGLNKFTIQEQFDHNPRFLNPKYAIAQFINIRITAFNIKLGTLVVNLLPQLSPQQVTDFLTTA